jgi:hypothetical protein
MPNDAKLGLVIGLALVIAVAVIYFRNDTSRRREEAPAATAVKPAAATRQPPPRGQARATKARPAVQNDASEQSQAETRGTTVVEGEPAKADDEAAKRRP